MRDLISLGYLDSKLDTNVKHLTAEVFHELTRSERVCDIIRRIEAEPDMEKKRALKEQLPVALFHVQMPEDGIRPKEGLPMKPSGLAMHDFDHLPVDPRNLYMQKISGCEKELGILLVHVTPRGEGLRLVTTLKDGESIKQCQERIASELNVSQYADKGVFDLPRISFIPSDDYVLFCDDRMFSMEEPEIPANPENPESPESPAKPANPDATANANALLAQTLRYEGIKYDCIIKEILSRIATNGQPKPGERNNDLFALVLNLRYCTDFNFELTRMLVSPYFPDLQDSEIRHTVNSAINAKGRQMPPTMRSILSQLKSEEDGIDTPRRMEIPKMPKMPPVIENIIRHYPKPVRNLVPFVCLPILGTYGTHIRFRYLDNIPNSLSFMTAIVGKSGRGKAFATHLFDNLMKPLAAWDKDERKKAGDYQTKMARRKQNEDFPEDPHAKIRIFSDDTTTSQMLEYLDDLNGEHGIQFTEEVNRIVKARRGHYADNDDLYCKAFNNGEAGKESKNNLTRNIKIHIYLNTLFCGTYDAMHSLYNNPQGGLNNRVIFAALPEHRTKGIPRYEDYTEEDWNLIRPMLKMLWLTGTKEQEDGLDVSDERQVHQGEKEFKFPFLDKTMTHWVALCDNEDDENPDETWRDLASRAAVTGYRAGVLFWFLWGCPKDAATLRLISHEAVWVAKSMRIFGYNFCGDECDRINAKENQQMRATRGGKNKKLFSVLSDTFTIQDVVNIRRQNGDSTDVYMIISRWKSEGFILKTSDGKFQKVKRIAI